MKALPILEARDIVKIFPGVRALDRVHLDLENREVHALVGENGAGKSTLMHILGGITKPDSGRILMEGRPIELRSAQDAARNRIAAVYQESALAQNLSIAENIFANRQPVRRFNLIDWGRLTGRTRELLKRFDLDLHPRTPVKHLTLARRQVVEILKAISLRPKVLLLDEPTSSLTAPEMELLFRNMEEMKGQGTSFIYISHHLPEIFRIADRVTVFRDGKYVDTLKTSDATERILVKLMVGRDLSNIYGQRKLGMGEEYFRVEGAWSENFQDVSFSLRKGEILGLAGLVGAGRTELGRALFGVEPLERGRILLDGLPIRIRSTGEAIRMGIGYLTEDRKDQGLFLGMDVRANCIAPGLRRFANRLGWMNEGMINRYAEENCLRFNIITPGIAQPVRNLSGGNQQKVLLSMWIGMQPKVLIADEPTRGVDVGARSEIYRLLRDLASTGVGIVLISSDLMEILGLSDRILVMRQGRVAAQFSREQATEGKIIACAAGVDWESPHV